MSTLGERLLEQLEGQRSGQRSSSEGKKGREQLLEASTACR